MRPPSRAFLPPPTVSEPRFQVLLYLMYAIRYHLPDKPTLGGAGFTIQEVQELEGLNLDGIEVLEALTKPTVAGPKGRLVDAPCRARLRKQGSYWAQHILEGPIVWILSMLYIVVTVTLGATPLSAITAAVFAAVGDDAPDEVLPCAPVLLSLIHI